MRYLIAFLMVFSLNLSSANALESKTFPVFRKSTTKTNFLSKKEIHSLNDEPNYELVDRIHHDINHYVLNSINFVESIISLKFISTQNIKAFKRNVNHSYRFIFNCLFPKHTFW